MKGRFAVAGALAVLASTVMGGQEESPTRALRFPHASVEAYPSASISTRDERTGLTFYVESDGRTMVALDREGKPAWGLDVFAESRLIPSDGRPVIRSLRVEGDRLWAGAGKHAAYKIDVATGRVVSFMQD